MITLKFTQTFKTALTRRIERHQTLIVNSSMYHAKKIYDYMVTVVKEYHENSGTWLFWLDKKLTGFPTLRLYYSGELFDTDSIHGWITSKMPDEFLKYGDVLNRVSLAKEELERLKKNKHYKQALMLLKYSSSLETITVPIDFLEWFEK